jgi:single-strand DNA-binding protein
MNYQKLVVVGNVTADPRRQKSRKKKVAYTLFSVAVRDGKDDPVFFPVAAFNKLGQNVARYVTKGRLVVVEGRLTASKEGRLGVVADRVVFGPQKSNPAPEPEADDMLE